MKNSKTAIDRNAYKIVLSDLRIRPFGVIKAAFALMGLIPLLIFLYLIIGRNFLYDLFLGGGGFIAVFAIVISLIGFWYAYRLVRNMVAQLLTYAYERKCADDEKTEMVIGVSHDLKTPLTVVKAGIDNVLAGLAGPLNDKQDRIVRDCIDSINKLIRFIQELLDTSKLQFLRTNMKREFIDLTKIVEREVSGISELAKSKNLDIKYETEGKDLRLWADKNKLSRLVMNLLSNAAKYTPSKGRIKVVLSEDEDTIRLSVINTGPGIAADEIGEIFNKFERPHGHEGIEGVGLGLSIVKDIVDLHKGRVTAKSEPGKETEFSVVLPKDLRRGVRRRD